VLNPLNKSPACVLSKGNLLATTPTATYGSVGSSLYMTSGKWYWEIVITTIIGSTPTTGIAKDTYPGFRGDGYYPGYTADSWGYFPNTGGFANNNVVIATYTAATAGNTLMFAYDADSGKFYLGLQGTWFNSGIPESGIGAVVSSGLLGTQIAAAMSTYSGSAGTANFGAKAFTYTPPTGFKALCTANLPEGTAAAPATFTGNASADGAYIAMNGTPETLSINGNAVTWGTHADRTAGGVKLRTASASYNED
jgi:hypothetical protein